MSAAERLKIAGDYHERFGDQLGIPKDAFQRAALMQPETAVKKMKEHLSRGK